MSVRWGYLGLLVLRFRRGSEVCFCVCWKWVGFSCCFIFVLVLVLVVFLCVLVAVKEWLGGEE